MRTPTLTDIIKDLRETSEALDATDVDFGDEENANVEVPTITSMTPTVTYYASPVTKTPYARIQWAWLAPVMHDEDGNVISPTDPDILDDVTFDPVVDYMFRTALNGATPTTFASTKGSTSVITQEHPLGSNVTGTVYAVLKSGIKGPAYSVEATVSKDTTAPNRPSTPTLTSSASIISVIWDGLDYLGNAQPSDYNNTVVYADASNPPTTPVGILTGRGVCAFHATAGSTIYVQLVSQDMSYNQSTGSTVVSIVSQSVLDDTDLADALANKAVIYTQTADPTTTLPTGTVKDGDWWFKTNATVTSQIDMIYKRVSGAWVTDTINAADVIAAQSIVANNIATNAITANKILAGELAAKLATTGELRADIINGGIINAAITISAALQTAAVGTRCTLDYSGFKMYAHNTVTGNDDIVINFDAVTGLASFFGNVVSNNLIANGVVTLNSPTNIMNPNTALILYSGIQPPSSGPIVTNEWDSVQLKNSDGSNASPTFVSRMSDGKFVGISGTYTTVKYTIYNTDGTWNSDVTPSNFGPNVNYGFGAGLQYLVVIDDYAYSIGVSGDDGGTNYYFDIYATKLATGDTVQFVTPGGTNWKFPMSSSPRFGTDGTNIILSFSTTIRMYSVSRTGETYTVTYTATKSNIMSNPDAIMRGTLDTGTDSFLMSSGSSNMRMCLYSTMVENTNGAIPQAASGTNIGLGYYSSVYWCAKSGGAVYFYNGVSLSTPTATRDFGITYYNTAPYESKMSPRTTATIKRLAKINLAVSGWSPGVPDANVTQLRYYCGTVAGTVYAQGNNTEGQIVLTSLATSGDTPPTSSSFPESAPAVITNSDETLVISGDGTIHAKNGARFKGTITSNTAVSSGFNRLVFTETLDEGTNFDGTYFVVPETGYYAFTVAVPTGTSANRRFIALVTGTASPGSNTSLGRIEGPASGYSSFVVTYDDIYLTAGTSVSVELYAENALTTTTGIRPDLCPCFFSGKRSL